MRRHALPIAIALLALPMAGLPAGAADDGDISEACPAGRVPEDGFADVAAGTTHEAAVDCLVWWDVSSGRTWTDYDPEQTVPRDQMATFVARLLEAGGMTLPSDPDDLYDDDERSPHELRINQLGAVGVVNGTGPRQYSPGRPVTRGQTAALLVRGYETVTGTTLPEGQDRFDDDDGTEHEAAINAAAQAGWANGVGPGRFAPGRTLRRDEMGSFLARVLDTFVERGDATPPAAWATGAPPQLKAARIIDFQSPGLSPTYVTSPPGDDRLFVVERRGRVRFLAGGGLNDWLDIRDRVSTEGERGLLSVAFAPGWPDDGRVYVSYTDTNGDSRLDVFDATASDADESSRRQVAFQSQPASNHNGGLVVFGPDGLLWWGLGDGGGSGDTYGNGQDGSTALGGLNRYDPDAPGARAVGNDFGARSLYAIGLRNPWRFAFDPVTDFLYVADVGQGDWEEVDVVPARTRGLNYGWPEMEGDHCYQGSCDPSGFVQPAFEYGHDEGCSITGGIVYRGSAIDGLQGHYLFSDYCSGKVRSLRYDGTAVRDVTSHPGASGLQGQIVSFGTDDAGEPYVVTTSAVYRLLAAG